MVLILQSNYQDIKEGGYIVKVQNLHPEIYLLTTSWLYWKDCVIGANHSFYKRHTRAKEEFIIGSVTEEGRPVCFLSHI